MFVIVETKEEKKSECDDLTCVSLGHLQVPFPEAQSISSRTIRDTQINKVLLVTFVNEIIRCHIKK